MIAGLTVYFVAGLLWCPVLIRRPAPQTLSSPSQIRDCSLWVRSHVAEAANTGGFWSRNMPKKSSKASFVSSYQDARLCCCFLFITAMNSLSKPGPKDHYENVWIARTPGVKGFPSFLRYEIQVRFYA